MTARKSPLYLRRRLLAAMMGDHGTITRSHYSYFKSWVITVTRYGEQNVPQIARTIPDHRFSKK
jgi:hypothetical protein